jgi:hypothetical protein
MIQKDSKNPEKQEISFRKVQTPVQHRGKGGLQDELPIQG